MPFVEQEIFLRGTYRVGHGIRIAEFDPKGDLRRIRNYRVRGFC